MDDLSRQVDLRVSTLERHPLVVAGPAARDHVFRQLHAVHDSPEAVVEALAGPDGPLAVFAWAHFEESFFGTPVDRIAFDQAPGAPIRPWLDAILARELPRMTSPLDAMIDAHYPDAIRAMLVAGLGLDSVQLVGSPTRALEALGDATHAGLELRPLRRADLDRTAEFERDLFAREPQWCFFGASRGFVASRRATLETSLSEPGSVERSVYLEGQYVGHASATVQRHGLFGELAGMSFGLDPRARGRGLLRPMYRHLLEAALEHGADCFRGGTSQPPVLHLAKVMGRTPQAWLMRRSVPFTPDHFGDLAP